MSRLAAHYEAVRRQCGYRQVDDELGPFSDPTLRRRFVAVDGAAVLASALDRSTLVCMGVGMTGPPHLGTVGQLLTAIELQAAGLDVQFVLADLEPYHGGGNEAAIRRLAERYRAFALDLGFDPDSGVLRTQSEARDVMATGHRLARYYDPDGWAEAGADEPTTEWAASVEELYRATDANGGDSDGPTSAAADAHGSVLHGADFLHPLRTGEYEQVVCCFGIDEHDLTPWTRKFRDAAGISGRVAGVYTRMVPGFGVPKQSKSIGAGVSLASDPGAVRERLRSPPDPADPERSTAFQAMCLASRYDTERLAELAAACESGGEAWTETRRAYAVYVSRLAEQWHATSSDATV